MTAESGGQQFLKYLKGLSVKDLHKLYESSATCVAVLRYLPPVEQLFIMRMVLVEKPVPLVVIESWLDEKNKKSLESSLEVLRDLHLIEEDTLHSKCVLLTPTFRIGLRKAVLTGKLSCVEEASVDEKYHKTPSDLEFYGRDRWECVLKYLALPSSETERAVSSECRQVLQMAGFVKTNTASDLPEITSSGFKFLLSDTTSQLWVYLLNYLKYLEAAASSVVEPLTFLFHLSFCTIGKAYSSKNLSDFMEDFLQQLREAGIVYQRKRKSGWFYPTPLALSLSSGVSYSSDLPESFAPPSLLKGDKRKGGFIVVETNYRIYAYTDSLLQLSIVSTFSDMTYRFGNLSVGVISRESVRRALQVGITSQQIVDYLKCNARDIMLANPNILPPVICDQLRLWELERDRFQFDEGALFSNFLSDAEFVAFRDHAANSQCLLWENATSRLVVIKNDGVDAMKHFWKQHKA